MIEVAAVALLIALMEVCRLGWHGHWRKSALLYCGHLVCILGLYLTFPPGALWTGLYWASLAFTCGSYITLDGPWPKWRPAHKWDRWHLLLSGPSALPIQTISVVLVCWHNPLWLGLFVVEGILIKYGLWQWDVLRPDHWRVRDRP